jgi:hypothetical protein
VGLAVSTPDQILELAPTGSDERIAADLNAEMENHFRKIDTIPDSRNVNGYITSNLKETARLR